MSIIVDGYNYIGHSRELELSDPTAKDKVIYLLGRYCSRVHKSLTIVFDGNYFVDRANRKRQYGGVSVIYTSPIYTADEMIKKMIKRQEPRRRKALLVVSSDSEILQYTRSHGASAVRSEDFEDTIIQALASNPEIDRTHVHVSSQEVQEWLKIFESNEGEHKSSGASEKNRKAVSEPEIGKPKIARSRTVKKNVERIADASQTSKTRSRSKRKELKQRKSQALQIEQDLDRTNVHLSPEEVQEWMKIFGAKTEE
jgi:predicted RNA-binding protein with PIN domain